MIAEVEGGEPWIRSQENWFQRSHLLFAGPWPIPCASASVRPRVCKTRIITKVSHPPHRGSFQTGDAKPFRKPERTVQTRKLVSRTAAARPQSARQIDAIP